MDCRGANLIHDVGYLESGLTGSFEMIVLTDELVGLADHLLKGIEVNEETLMLDELDEIGPGGHFLNTANTHARFRDFWYPDLLSREIRDSWVSNGGKSLGEKLNQKVKSLIKEHQPEPLSDEAKKGLAEILKKADKDTK